MRSMWGRVQLNVVTACTGEEEGVFSDFVSSSSAASVPPTEEHPNEPETHTMNQDNSSQPEQFTNPDVPELQTESQREANCEGQTEPPLVRPILKGTEYPKCPLTQVIARVK